MTQSDKTKPEIRPIPGEDVFDVNVKRFYIPFELSATCPHCEERVTRRLNTDPAIYYPTLGTWKPYTLYHEYEGPEGGYEEHEFAVELRLTLQAEVRP